MAEHNLDQLTDESLMERIQRGDHEAFSALVFRHSRKFYAAAYRICGNAEDAEDIVQDAFLKLWRRAESWDASKKVKFTTWFYRVVNNQAIDFLRKKKNKPQDSYEVERISDETDGQQKVLEKEEQAMLLENAIQLLPERQKAALNLCFYEEMSNKDAVDVLGVSVKALESLLMRAKSGLRDVLMRQGVIGNMEDESYDGREAGYGS